MSISLQVHLGEHDSTYRADGMEHTLPVGSATLAGLLTTDPPAAEDLTNAIGLLADHLEDVVREVPAASRADEVVVSGPGIATLAAVEVGGATALPFALGKAAAEEVFRTLATECAADRRHNPGLPAAEVESVLGVCCAVVALLRRLDRQQVTLAPEQGV